MRYRLPTTFNVLCTLACSALWLPLAACASAASEPQKLGAEESAAVEVAKKTLDAAAPGAGISAKLQSIQPHQWRDSSLGCPQPGVSYMQVITNGYVVNLSSGDRIHEVRVAGANGVICPMTALGSARRPAHRVTNLDAMEKGAIADLAGRIGVDAKEIRVAKRIPQRWANDTLDCAAPGVGQSSEGAVAGFVLVLRHGERYYNYHTDMQRVMACPPIDAQ